MKIIGGGNNQKLLQEIADLSDLEVVDVEFGKFPDGETRIEIKESLLGQDVIIVQSTCHPVNDNLMEIILLVDVLHREMVDSISLIIPYFGYSRQDRQMPQASPVSAKVVASILSNIGVDKITTIDLHSEYSANLFDIFCLNISSASIFIQDIKEKKLQNFVIVAPDFGALKRARIVADELGCEVVVLEKKRIAAGKSTVLNLIGDVKDKNCIIIDDIIDSGGTIFNAAEFLQSKGALEVSAYITHGVCSPKNFIEKLEKSQLKELIISNSIKHNFQSVKLRILSIAGTISNYIDSYLL